MKKIISLICVISMMASLVVMPHVSYATEDGIYVDVSSFAGNMDSIKWYYSANGYMNGQIPNLFAWNEKLETAGWDFNTVIAGDEDADFEVSFDFNAVYPEKNITAALGIEGETLNGFGTLPYACDTGYSFFRIGSVSGSEYTLTQNTYLDGLTLAKGKWYTLKTYVLLGEGKEKHVLLDRSTGAVVVDTGFVNLRTGNKAWESTKSYDKIRFTVSNTGGYGNLQIDNVSVKKMQEGNVSGGILKSDFENGKPLLYSWDSASVSYRGYYDVKTDASGNNYARVSSVYSNGGGTVADGFKFLEPIEWGKKYKLKFDFAIEAASRYDMLALVDDLPQSAGGSYDAWSEFALAEIKDGELFINEQEVTKENGISWNLSTEDRAYWYNYDMDIDMSLGEYSVTITDKNDSLKRATFNGTFPSEAYYGMTVGCGGIMWFDNMEVYETSGASSLKKINFIEGEEVAVEVLTDETKKIQLTFDEPMDKTSLDENLSLRNETKGENLTFTSQISENVYTIILDEKPIEDNRYSIFIPKYVKTEDGMFMSESYSREFVAKSCYDLLFVDYNAVSYIPERLLKSTADLSVHDGYLEISTNYANEGYPLNGIIPNVNREYMISFDFMLLSDEISGYPIMLTEKATETNGTTTYAQFGLLGVENGKFILAERALEGNFAETGKWYNYKLIFNPKTTDVELEITDIENPDRVAFFKGAVSDREYYGDGMPERNYDTFQFTYRANMAIDNIEIKANDEKPVFYKVSSAHVGNIFGENDEKKLNITMQNPTASDITAEIYYTVYDESGAEVTSGSAGVVQIDARGYETVEKIVDISKFGVYKIQFKTVVDGETYLSEKYDLSVVNKGDKLNDYLAVNTPYISDMEEWRDFKEVLTQAGIKTIRKDVLWSEVEREKGKYSIPETLCYIKDLDDSGMEYMAILNAAHTLYSSDGSNQRPNVTNTNEAWAAWEGYIDYVSKAFKGKIKYYEIINESSEYLTSLEYAEYMKRAKAIIDRNDPDALVVGFSTASVPWWWILEVMSIVRSNPSAYLDILSIHPYDFHNNDYEGNFLTTTDGLHWGIKIRDNVYTSKVKKLKNYMSTYRLGNMPVHATEMAVSSTPGLISARGQAAELAQLYTINMTGEGIEKTYWYCLECTSERGYNTVIENDSEGNFGLVGSRKDPVPLSAKPAYVAMTAFNKMMSGATYVNKIDTSYADAYRFNASDGDGIVVLWAEHATNAVAEYNTNISLNLGCTSVEVFDMYGNSLGVIENADGIYDFAASMEPLYIKGDFKSFSKATGKITLSHTKFNIAPDGEKTITVTDSKGRNLNLEAEGNEHINIEETQNIYAGIGSIKLKMKGGAGEEQDFTVKIYDGNTLIYCSKVYAYAEKRFLDSVWTGQKEVTGYLIGTDISVRINGENLASDSTGKLVIGYYDGEGRMLGIQGKDFSLGDRGFTDINVSLNMPNGTKKVNLMVIGASFTPYSENLVYFVS